MLNEVPLEAWLTLDSCYLIGWNQKIPAGIPADFLAGITASAGPLHYASCPSVRPSVRLYRLSCVNLSRMGSEP